MRKGLKILCALALFATVPTVLTACGENSSIVDENQEMVDSALKELTVDAEVSNNFRLVVSARGGVAISWASNNELITINGSDAVVTRPTDNDASVKLTATATKGNATGTRDFTVTVKKIEVADTITISEAIAAAVGTNVAIRGVVSNFSYKDDSTNAGEQYIQGMYLTDATGTIYVYGPKAAQAASIGDEVTLKADREDYTNKSNKAVQQVKNPTEVVTIAKNKNVPLDSAIKGKTLAEIYAADDSLNKVFIADVKVQAFQGSGFVNYEIMDANGKYILLQGSQSGKEFESLVSDTYTSTAFAICHYTNKGAYKAVIISTNVQ